MKRNIRRIAGHTISRRWSSSLVLRAQRDADASLNSALSVNWQTVKDWKETVRYLRKTRSEAEKLYQAVTDTANGVLPWIRNHW